MYKMSLGEKIFNIFNIFSMFLFVMISLYPFLHILAVSLSDGLVASAGLVFIIPVKFTLANYNAIFFSHDIFSAFRFSVFRTILGTIMQLFITTIAAYTLAQKKLPGRAVIIMYLFIPCLFSGGLVPTYIVYRTLGLMNNFWVYIIPGLFGFFNMVLLRTFFEQIPASLQESARIDGAMDMQVFRKIILPLSKPILATISLFLAVGHWNDWFTTLLFAFARKDLWSLQYILQLIFKEATAAQELADKMMQYGGMKSGTKITPKVIQYATLIISTVPIIIVYPFLQKHFAKGVLVGAIKS